MAEIKVIRTYKVTISDEDLSRIEATEFGSAELLDGATREADAGNQEGALHWVKGDLPFADPTNRGDYWATDTMTYEVVLDSVAYEAHEIDVTIE